MMIKRLLFLLIVFTAVVHGFAGNRAFEVGKGTFLLDGKPFVIKAAELHYPRIPQPYWEHRIKMCKALGMNTICLYVFWNAHEQHEGVFDFSGQYDVAAFCRLCQKHGLFVIVRPGPYVCAEWEMGGLPWWLLKKKDIKLRERDPYFMERVKEFEQEVGRQLAPLTIANGGPIIMVQAENEYGSYGIDKAYVGEIRDMLRNIYGNEVTIFQCDWASNFENNGLDDLLWTMNFGTGANIDEQFKRLDELRPDAPKMCSEFWSGWFDKWGTPHETRSADEMVAGIDEMLSKCISFSLYMTHGGTSFGHWAGAASPGFVSYVTSYDYDAPINEYGRPTEKYYKLRETLGKYCEGNPLPPVPKPIAPTINVPHFSFSEYAPLPCGITTTTESHDLLTFEEMDMGWGTAIYVATLPEIPSQSLLTLNEIHDYAQVFVNGRYIGKLDRAKNLKSLTIPSARRGDRLMIVVDAMGRVNFSQAIKDNKGITKNVTVTTVLDGHDMTLDLKSWTISLIPDDYGTALKALSAPDGTNAQSLESKAGYYRAEFDLKRTGDTFLNMEAFGRGQVYVNGHAIGRFWNIGPQQTLYVPGCWLQKGKNEVVVLDVVGPKRKPVAFCQDCPLLDKLQLDESLQHDNEADRPDLSQMSPVHTGTFAGGNGWQTVRFAQAKRGSYLAIEVLSNQEGANVSAIAEIYLHGVDGRRLNRESWTARYADSEDVSRNHVLDRVYDLQESTYWQTEDAPLPHLLVIDLGGEQTITGLEYLPRAEQGAPCSIKGYRVFVY